VRIFDVGRNGTRSRKEEREGKEGMRMEKRVGKGEKKEKEDANEDEDGRGEEGGRRMKREGEREREEQELSVRGEQRG
jgi:hypothetical protein